MSLFEEFQTDPTIEREGFEFVFTSSMTGDPLFRCRLSRFGHGQKRYDAATEKIMAPYRRAKKLSDDVKIKTSRQIFAEGVVVPNSWETYTAEGYVPGVEMHQADGTDKIEPATVANITKVLMSAPDLYMLLAQEALDIENFRRESLEEDTKNS
jgi:hypothetical protein